MTDATRELARIVAELGEMVRDLCVPETGEDAHDLVVAARKLGDAPAERNHMREERNPQFPERIEFGGAPVFMRDCVASEGFTPMASPPPGPTSATAESGAAGEESVSSVAFLDSLRMAFRERADGLHHFARYGLHIYQQEASDLIGKLLGSLSDAHRLVEESVQRERESAESGAAVEDDARDVWIALALDGTPVSVLRENPRDWWRSIWQTVLHLVPASRLGSARAEVLRWTEQAAQYAGQAAAAEMEAKQWQEAHDRSCDDVASLHNQLAAAERERDAWWNAALCVGEALYDDGPIGYYAMKPEDWRAMIVKDITRLRAESKLHAKQRDLASTVANNFAKKVGDLTADLARVTRKCNSWQEQARLENENTNFHRDRADALRARIAGGGRCWRDALGNSWGVEPCARQHDAFGPFTSGRFVADETQEGT